MCELLIPQAPTNVFQTLHPSISAWTTHALPLMTTPSKIRRNAPTDSCHNLTALMPRCTKTSFLITLYYMCSQKFRQPAQCCFYRVLFGRVMADEHLIVVLHQYHNGSSDNVDVWYQTKFCLGNYSIVSHLKTGWSQYEPHKNLASKNVDLFPFFLNRHTCWACYKYISIYKPINCRLMSSFELSNY